MVLHLEIGRCLVCTDGKHDLCPVVYKDSWPVRRENGKMSREVVYTTCQCAANHHQPETKGVLKQ